MICQIEEEIASCKPIERTSLMNFFSEESIHCRWVVLETDSASGELVVGAARVILGSKDGHSVGVVDTLYAACFPDLTETMRMEVIRLLLHKIEVVGSNIGLFSMNLLVPLAPQESILDSKNATVDFVEQCGYFEAGGHRLERLQESGPVFHMVLLFSKSLLRPSQPLHEMIPSTDLLTSSAENDVDIESVSIIDRADSGVLEQQGGELVFALMESLISSLNKESISIS
jgi:hypothetical protein